MGRRLRPVGFQALVAWIGAGPELTRSTLRHAELGLERHDLDPDLAVRQGKRRPVGACELGRVPNAGPAPLEWHLCSLGDEHALAAAYQADIDAAGVVVRDRLDIRELDDDRRGGVLLTGAAVFVRLAVHDASVHLLAGIVVVLDAVALRARVRDLDGVRRLLTGQVGAEVQRTHRRIDSPTALAKHVANGGGADERVVRGLAIGIADESAIAARLVDVGEPCRAKSFEALGRRADMDQWRSVLVGEVDEVVARASNGADPIRLA